MSRFGIATLFEDVPDGYEFTKASTPLHLTHVDVCEVDLEPAEFVSKLRDYVADIYGFKVIPTEDTLLGPDKDIPVTLVELSPALQAFHAHILNFLMLNNAVLDNPQFHNQSYSPHISIYGHRRVSLGRPVSIKSISIGNKRTGIENPPNRIIATIPLA